VSVIQTNLQGLFNKEVSRKEFLGVVGLALLSVFGLGTLVKLLTGKSLETHHAADGYGSSIYNGTKRGRL
jgi:hypothetical protein